MYKDKYITIDEALKMVKTGDVIVTGLAASEARSFLSRLHEIADHVVNVEVTNCLPMLDAEYFINSKYKTNFNVAGWFYTNPLRKAQENGNISYIPNHLHLAGKKRFDFKKPTIYIGNATYPDKHGYMSLSLSNVYEKDAISKSDIVILEVNKKLPRTFGDLEIHVSDVTGLIETDYDIPTLAHVESGDKDHKIGEYIADYIHDGDCIQLGIGAIPNAVAMSLMSKKDLGIHTEMFTTGMMELVKAGVVTNKKKTLHKNKSICAFALGSKELYDFLDDNPSILILDGHYVNDPYTIGLNDNQISINTSIEVDLSGQCASESIGYKQYSGTGGQADTAIGAQRSKNGKSFIALYSTAMVLNKETMVRERIGKIVPFLKQGANVSLSRNDVDYVVTEYGVAELRGTTIKERVERLIAISHPDFKESLRRDAIEMGYIVE